MHDQLKQIAATHSISEERLPEILAAIKVTNVDKPTKVQLKGAEQLCALLATGTDLEAAAAQVMATAKQQRSSGPQAASSPTALSVSSSKGLVQPPPVPEGVRQGIAHPIREQADQALTEVPGKIARATNAAEDQFMGGLEGFVHQTYYQAIEEGMADPAFVEKVRAAIASGKSPRFSSPG